MKKALITCSLLLLVLLAQPSRRVKATTGVLVDAQLSSFLAASPLSKMASVITYNRMPSATELNRLQTLGITKGFALRQLPMVITDLNLAQLNQVRTQPGVLSVYGNRVMTDLGNISRRFIGVPQMTADTAVTARNASNPGFPVSGKGIGIGYIDTGIDATHRDLQYGTKTRQNVIQPLSEGVVSLGTVGIGLGVSIADLIADTGFVPPIYIENQPFTDLESGHGTHGAAVAAGTGEMSGGFYGGVAKGAHLIGLNAGNDFGLPLVALIGAFDYLLVNQYTYNIRVVNNSWGSSYDAAEVDPRNPINVATRIAHDRNMVVVFAAGNAGDTPTSINPYSTLPWTFSVAAGEKQGLGTPTDFSSRGINNGGNSDVTTLPADPDAPANLRPDITAPGADIKSARSKGPGLVPVAGTTPIFVGGNDLTTIPPAFLPYYTTSRGTSFACPHVAGVVALMLEANPALTPAQVFKILRQTANPMPYEERVVGAGYVDAHNAVRAVLGLSAVAHPFNLFPTAGGPEITDLSEDQLGTGAQDIVAADFAYDATNRQIVYTLTLKDLATRTTNMRWTQSHVFKSSAADAGTTVFVTTAIDETGAVSYQYGKIVILATGTRQQTRLGSADAGAVQGNQIIVRLSVDKLSLPAALGYDVVGKTSTTTEVIAQILVGSSASGGLLLAADTASGSDFKVAP
jgi:serine protease AprX